MQYTVAFSLFTKMDKNAHELDFKDAFILFLDLTTIGFCVTCKIPQIFTILTAKSAVGLSLNGVCLEFLGYSVTLAYNVMKAYRPISYLEYAFLAAEDIVLIFVMLYYMGSLEILKIGGMGAFVALFYGFAQGVPSPEILPFLLKFVTPISVYSKVLHFNEILSFGNSDSISLTMWTISAYTCITRIATNLMGTAADSMLLLNYITSLTFNSAIIIAIVYFRRYPRNQNILDSDDEHSD